VTDIGSKCHFNFLFSFFPFLLFPFTGSTNQDVGKTAGARVGLTVTVFGPLSPRQVSILLHGPVLGFLSCFVFSSMLVFCLWLCVLPFCFPISFFHFSSFLFLPFYYFFFAVLASGRVYSYLGGRWSARTYSFLLSFLFFSRWIELNGLSFFRFVWVYCFPGWWFARSRKKLLLLIYGILILSLSGILSLFADV
jgi:hypothetical protein